MSSTQWYRGKGQPYAYPDTRAEGVGMSTLTQTMTRQDQERARLLSEIAHLQTELTRVRVELAQTWARVDALNTYTFTLTFAGGQVALLEVRGAANQEEARTIAQYAIKRCQYSVTDGDQTGGNAHCFYYWCRSERETTTREKKRSDAPMHPSPQ